MTEVNPLLKVTNSSIISKYDNNITIAYKYAHQFSIPTRLLVITKNQQSQTSYYSFLDIVNNLVNQGKNLAEIYEEFLNDEDGQYFIANITIDDIPMYVVNEYNRQVNPGQEISVVKKNFSRNNQEDFLKIINDYYQIIENQMSTNLKFNDFNAMVNSANNWTSQIIQEINEDKRLYDIVIEVQKELSEIENFPQQVVVNPQVSEPFIIDYTAFSEISRQLSYQATYNGIPIRKEFGIDIFNEAHATPVIPFIQYYDERGRIYTKVYTEDDTIAPLDYKNLIPSINNPMNNMIYFQLFVGKVENLKMTKIIKQSFYLVHFNLSSNFMLLKGSENEEEDELQKNILTIEEIKNRIKHTFSSINLYNDIVTKISGDFMVWIPMSPGIPVTSYWPQNPGGNNYLGIDESVFVNMILCTKLFHHFLYIEESNVPFSRKKRLDIHYRSLLINQIEPESSRGEQYVSNSANVSFTIKNRLTTKMTQVFTKNYPQGVNLPIGFHYISVNITNGKSEKDVQEFFNIFPILLKYYRIHHIENRVAINHQFPDEQYLSKLLQDRKELKKKKNITQINAPRGRKNDATLLNRLRDLLPEIYRDKSGLSGYSQNPIKIAVTPEEISTLYSNLDKITVNGIPQMVRYPAGENGIIFYCENDKVKKFIGMKVGDDKSNTDPNTRFLPLCYKSAHLKPKSTKPIQQYLNAVQNMAAGGSGKVEATKVNTEDTQAEGHRTQKLGEIGQTSQIPQSIKIILQYTSKISEFLKTPGNFSRVRYNIDSPNSFIHCILGAVDDPYYFQQLGTSEQREEYCRFIRKNITEQMNMELLRQENVLTPLEDIKKSLLATETYLNPLLYYRLFEESFNINIYFFTYTDDGQDGVIVLPYHRGFYARTRYQDRKTLLILLSQHKDNKEYQSEIICDLRKIENNEVMIKLFDNTVEFRCFSMLNAISKTLTWIRAEKGLILHENIYSGFNIRKIFEKFSMISQFIDRYGKARRFTFIDGEIDDYLKLIPGSGSGLKFTVFCPPAQPENVPHSEEIYYIPVTSLVKMAGLPISITKDINDQINGFWYRLMDLKNGIYFPVSFTSSDPGVNLDVFKQESQNIYELVKNKNLGPEQIFNYLAIENTTKKISRLRRKMNIILDILRYLFEIFRHEHGISRTLDEFWNVYITIIESGDEMIYDLTHLQRILPKELTILAAIQKLRKQMPRAFTDNTMILYNQQLAIKCYNFLRDYIRSTYGIVTVIPITIPNFYQELQDFRKYPDNYVFIDRPNFYLWFNQYNKNTRNLARITEEVNYTNDREPFFYQTPSNKLINIEENSLEGQTTESKTSSDLERGGKIYLIQNVQEGNLMRALQVAYYWSYYHVNIGYDAQPYEGEHGSSREVSPRDELVGKQPHPNFVIWGINNIKQIVPFEDHANGSNNFLEILYYGGRITGISDGIYAAMLPI